MRRRTTHVKVPLTRFNRLTLSTRRPTTLNRHYAMFVRATVTSTTTRNIPRTSVTTKLYRTVIRGCLRGIINSGPIKRRVMLRNNISCGPNVITTFRTTCNDQIQIDPIFSVDNTCNTTLLTRRTINSASDRFIKFSDPTRTTRSDHDTRAREGVSFCQRTSGLLLRNCAKGHSPHGGAINIPFILVVRGFFPVTGTFFASLKFGMILASPADRRAVQLSRRLTRDRAYCPIGLVCNRVRRLVSRGISCVFLPDVRAVGRRGDQIGRGCNYICVRATTISVTGTLSVRDGNVALLDPMFSLSFKRRTVTATVLKLNGMLNDPGPFYTGTLLDNTVTIHHRATTIRGRNGTLLTALEPSSGILILVAHGCNISSPVLGVNVPRLLLRHNCGIVALDRLPNRTLSVSSRCSGLCCPFKRRVLSKTGLVTRRPGLCTICLAGRNYNPSAVLSRLFGRRVKSGPCLRVRISRRFSGINIVAHVRTFLGDLGRHPIRILPGSFILRRISVHPYRLPTIPRGSFPL